MYKIEKGMPIPRTRSGRGENKALMQAMDIGDSFVLKAKNKASAWGSWYVIAKRLGYKITVRELGDGKYRLWRTA